MNSGIIAERYAGALFALVRENGSQDAVMEQVRTILTLTGRLPELKSLMTQRERISVEEKIALLGTCVAPAPLEKSLEDFLRLMHRNERDAFFRLALLDFLELYRREHNIMMVQVTKASPDVNPDLDIERIVKEKTGCTAAIREKVDPEIIGGFIVETWNWKLDASVRRQLRDVEKTLTQMSKRIV